MKYHITSVTPHLEGIEEGDVPADHGASVLYPEDGSCSTAFHSLDGRTAQPLSDVEMWKAWTLWAKRLSESPELTEGKKELCKLVFNVVCAAINDKAGNER